LKNAQRVALLMGGGLEDRNGWMQMLGARIAEAEPGRVVVEIHAGPQHRQGAGVVQGGVITQIADAAMGMSLATMQEDRVWNTTIELKINFLRPAIDGRLRAVGRVVEIKQSLLFGEADVFDEQGRLIATASSTCMAVPEGEGRV
jgi:uncharacterized protein (TIGR00369 family)